MKHPLRTTARGTSPVVVAIFANTSARRYRSATPTSHECTRARTFIQRPRYYAARNPESHLLQTAKIESNIGMEVDGSLTTGLAHSTGTSFLSNQSSDCPLEEESASSTPDPGDRVFPIRSIVSADQYQPTPWSCNVGEHAYLPRLNSNTGVHHHTSNVCAELEIIREAESLPISSTRTVHNSPAASVNVEGKGKNTLSGSITSPTCDSQPLSVYNDSSSSASSAAIEEATLPGRDNGSSLGGRGPSAELNKQLYTTQSRHATTEEGQYVITGVKGTQQRYEDEPIYIAGVVQSFGLLVALKEETDGRFIVQVVSENSGRILGLSPQQLFRLESFLDIFSDEQGDNILDHIDFVRDKNTNVAANGPEVFSVSLRPQKGQSLKLWCAMHISCANRDFIICEFELEDDHEQPLRPANEIILPVSEDRLYQTPTPKEVDESTKTSSKPLRTLHGTYKMQREAGVIQILDTMSHVQQQLASAPDLDKLLNILVGIVKEVTDFHRVMIYQFDSSYNGKVVAELVDPSQTRDLYKGLHFPASDIPIQASELHKTNNIQILYDRNLELARLVYRMQADMEHPLDLTDSYLCAIPPLHLKYLASIGVRASMSISINAFSKPWGLIACHSYGPRGMRVALRMRKMCRYIGDMASRDIERLTDALRLRARNSVNTVPVDGIPFEYFIASSKNLLTLLDADFGLLLIRGKTKILGKPKQSQEALAMLGYLRIKKFTSIIITQDVSAELPDLRYPPGFTTIAGMLYVPLSMIGQDFIVFFRKTEVKDVKLPGNLHEKGIKVGTSDHLELRTSFQVWHETTKGKCREWAEEQVETAMVLCLLNDKLVELWAQKETAPQNSRLIRLLLADAAHEARTPLNAIINYLEIALEGSLSQDTRDILVKSHLASKSFLHVINDLLELVRREEDRNLLTMSEV